MISQTYQIVGSWDFKVARLAVALPYAALCFASIFTHKVPTLAIRCKLPVALQESTPQSKHTWLLWFLWPKSGSWLNNNKIVLLFDLHTASGRTLVKLWSIGTTSGELKHMLSRDTVKVACAIVTFESFIRCFIRCHVVILVFECLHIRDRPYWTTSYNPPWHTACRRMMVEHSGRSASCTQAPPWSEQPELHAPIWGVGLQNHAHRKWFSLCGQIFTQLRDDPIGQTSACCCCKPCQEDKTEHGFRRSLHRNTCEESSDCATVPAKGVLAA